MTWKLSRQPLGVSRWRRGWSARCAPGRKACALPSAEHKGGPMYHIKIITTATIVLAALAAPLAAQEPQCAMPDPNATAACNTAVDAIRAFHPLAGMIVSGGNPVLGTSGSLGGIGHLTITARVNAIKASLPNPDSASQSRVPSSFHGAIPAPLLAAGLGIDHYRSSQTAVRFHDDPLNPAHVRTVVINPANTREVVFADAGLSLAVIKLVGEIGFQTGKDQSFATTFSNFDPKAGHVFGGVGLRFGF